VKFGVNLDQTAVDLWRCEMTWNFHENPRHIFTGSVSLYVPYDYQLLLVPAAMIVAWIIPGYLMRAKYKKVNA